MRYPASVIGIGMLVAVSAQTQSDKPNFSGNWNLNPVRTTAAAGHGAVLWMKIDQKGDTIAISRAVRSAAGVETVSEVHCTTAGQDCDAKGTIHSFFYMGDVLREMEIAGDNLIKRTYSLEAPGRLNVEVKYVDAGKTDKLSFEKTAAPVTF